MFEIKENINKILIIGVVAGLLVFLHFIGALEPAENVVRGAYKYVQGPAYDLGRGLFRSEEKMARDRLEEENEELKRQVEDYAVEISRLTKKLEDQQSYAKQMEFLENKEYRFVGAKIIGKTVDGQSQVYLLNQGSGAGIRPDFPVITENGILIGKVLEADASTARVLLLTSNLSRVGARVQNKDQSQGVVSGQHGLTLRMDLIAKDEPVDKYDIVVTSGLEEYMPEGLVIGQVEEVASRESELFKSAIISPLLDYRQQSLVSVIIP